MQELSNIEKIKSMLNKVKEAIDNLSITYTGGDNFLIINANKEFKNVVLSNNITNSNKQIEYKRFDEKSILENKDEYYLSISFV